jgi:hypothetical protein
MLTSSLNSRASSFLKLIRMKRHNKKSGVGTSSNAVVSLLLLILAAAEQYNG